jgi:hypothetical protein
MDPSPHIHHFSLGNAAGRHQGEVPSLLRRLATEIKAIGMVTIQDITFENEVNEHGLWPSMTVYFHYGALDDECACGRAD